VELVSHVQIQLRDDADLGKCLEGVKIKNLNLALIQIIQGLRYRRALRFLEHTLISF
jgi:hypothetical protein